MENFAGDFSRNSRILFLSVSAAIIGVASAFAAKTLLFLITFFTNIFYFGEASFVARAPSADHWGWPFVFVPVVGGLMIGLMARFGTEKIRGHGIPEALEAILFGKSIMQPKVALLKPLSSAISIGSGGPFGAEGPIIMTGGAIGSILAQFLHLTSSERKTLLVAGAAAGMSAVFNTPLAALLLAVELLLFEWKPRSFVPVAVAACTAALVRAHLLGAGPLFATMEHAPFADLDFMWAAVLGLLMGAFATFLSNALYKLEDFFHDLPIHWMWWPAMGGLVVGLGGAIEPRALGVGYDMIADLLAGHVMMKALLVFFTVKLVIWIFALASGTSGGVLAPLLLLGCSAGTFIAPLTSGSQTAGVWALIGMGAMMGGMMRSPLTAVAFCFELTRDSNVLLPLVAAASLAYAFTVWSMRRSILTEKVARRGYHIFREYSVDPLERSLVREVYTAAPSEAAVEANAFAIYEDESCRTAAEKMAQHEVAQLIVVAKATGKNLGLVTVADLLKARKQQAQEEFERETMFPVIPFREEASAPAQPSGPSS